MTHDVYPPATTAMSARRKALAPDTHQGYAEASCRHPSTRIGTGQGTVSDLDSEFCISLHDAFTAFSQQVFADGALPEVAKQLIAVAAAHTTQCPYCIRGHTRLARQKGASDAQIMEAIWVAAEMRAGGAYAHAAIALDALGEPGRPQQ